MSKEAPIFINDPVHKIMNFHNNPELKLALKTAIQTEAFQRLRRITQLGLASLVFPGATHTRFSHSLGAAYLAYQTTQHLRMLDKRRREEIENLQISVVMSTLLHDIGHGPFSHSFEKVLKELAKERNVKGRIPLHEDWTREIISNRKSEIYKVIKKCNLNVDRVVSPFQSENTQNSYPKFLRQIVSSQIDVDRMDYLVRDSHFTGVELGAIDLQYLIQCLTIIEHGGNSINYSLGISRKGIKTYEGYCIARHLMNRSVYYHPKVKVSEFIVETVFQDLIKNLIDSSGFRKKWGDYTPQYLRKVARQIEQGKSFSDTFLETNLEAYLQMCESDFWTLAKKMASHGSGRLKLFSEMIMSREFPASWTIKSGMEKIADETLMTEGVAKENYKIIKVSSVLYKESGYSSKVFVQDDDGNYSEASSRSLLLTLFKDKEESESLLVTYEKPEHKVSKTIQQILKSNNLIWSKSSRTFK